MSCPQFVTRSHQCYQPRGKATNMTGKDSNMIRGMNGIIGWLRRLSLCLSSLPLPSLPPSHSFVLVSCFICFISANSWDGICRKAGIMWKRTGDPHYVRTLEDPKQIIFLSYRRGCEAVLCCIRICHTSFSTFIFFYLLFIYLNYFSCTSYFCLQLIYFNLFFICLTFICFSL